MVVLRSFGGIMKYLNTAFMLLLHFYTIVCLWGQVWLIPRSESNYPKNRFQILRKTKPKPGPLSIKNRQLRSKIHVNPILRSASKICTYWWPRMCWLSNVQTNWKALNSLRAFRFLWLQDQYSGSDGFVSIIFSIFSIASGSRGEEPNKPPRLSYMEDLKTQQMVQGNFAKSIHDAVWGKFTNMIKYKAESAGSYALAVNPHHTYRICRHCAKLVKKEIYRRCFTDAPSACCGVVHYPPHHPFTFPQGISFGIVENSFHFNWRYPSIRRHCDHLSVLGK